MNSPLQSFMTTVQANDDRMNIINDNPVTHRIAGTRSTNIFKDHDSMSLSSGSVSSSSQSSSNEKLEAINKKHSSRRKMTEDIPVNVRNNMHGVRFNRRAGFKRTTSLSKIVSLSTTKDVFGDSVGDLQIGEDEEFQLPSMGCARRDRRYSRRLSLDDVVFYD